MSASANENAEPIHMDHELPLSVPAGHVVVPVEPTNALLMSMAVRFDHGLGVPGYYDSEFFAASGITHAQRLESALTIMRQLHEEVVGKGFHRGGRKLAGSGE